MGQGGIADWGKGTEAGAPPRTFRGMKWRGTGLGAYHATRVYLSYRGNIAKYVAPSS